MEKTTLYLATDIQRGLRGLSRRTRRPQAELIREVLERFLPGLGSGASTLDRGDGDAARVRDLVVRFADLPMGLVGARWSHVPSRAAVECSRSTNGTSASSPGRSPSRSCRRWSEATPEVTWEGLVSRAPRGAHRASPAVP